MEIRKLSFYDNADVVDLFESFAFQPYNGHGNTLGARATRDKLRDDVFWEVHDVYGFYENGILDCVDIIGDNATLPFRVSNSFMRFGDRKAYLDTGFDRNMKLLLDHTFKAEEVSSGLPRITMEMTELDGKKRPSYQSVFDSYAQLHYNRGILQVLEANKKYSYLSEEYPIFYNEFFDLRAKHTKKIQRTIFVYYKKSEVLE